MATTSSARARTLGSVVQHRIDWRPHVVLLRACDRAEHAFRLGLHLGGGCLRLVMTGVAAALISRDADRTNETHSHDTRPADPRPPPARGDGATRQAGDVMSTSCVRSRYQRPTMTATDEETLDFSRTPREHGHPFLPFWVYHRSCRCGHIDFVLQGSTELRRRAEGSGFFRPWTAWAPALISRTSWTAGWPSFAWRNARHVAAMTRLPEQS